VGAEGALGCGYAVRSEDDCAAAISHVAFIRNLLRVIKGLLATSLNKLVQSMCRADERHRPNGRFRTGRASGRTEAARG